MADPLVSEIPPADYKENLARMFLERYQLDPSFQNSTGHRRPQSDAFFHGFAPAVWATHSGLMILRVSYAQHLHRNRSAKHMKVAANPVKLSFNRGPKCPNDLDFISELWVFSCGVRAPPAPVTTIRWRSNRCYGGDCSCQISVEEDWFLVVG